MKKIKLIAASAIATLLAIPFAVANKPVGTYAAVEETERVFGVQDEHGSWSSAAYDQFSVDPSAKITKKGYFSANLAGYNATVQGQGLYKVGPKSQDNGKAGYIAITLRSDKGGVKLADISLNLKKRDSKEYVVFNGDEWTDETGTKAPELTETFHTYYLHMKTMFAAKGEAKVDWTEIHLVSNSKQEGKFLGINNIYYCANKTDDWNSKDSYRIDDFNRSVIDDKSKLTNIYWLGGAGDSKMNGPSYYSAQSKALLLASKKYGNVDGKFSNFSFEAKYGDITKFTPIYLNGEEFVKGNPLDWTTLRNENNVPMKKIAQLGAKSGFINLNVNLANSGIKATTLAGFEIQSASAYLANMRWTNSVNEDIKVFAQEILDKTGPHCDVSNPEAIKSITADWTSLSTKWNNMSTTAKAEFLKFKSAGSITALNKEILAKPIKVELAGKNYKYLTGAENKETNLERIVVKVTSDKEYVDGLASLRFEFINKDNANTFKWCNGAVKGPDGKAVNRKLEVGENTIVVDLAKTGIDGNDIKHIHVHFGNNPSRDADVKFTLNSIKLQRNEKIDPMAVVDAAKERYTYIVTKYEGQHGINDFLDIINANQTNAFNIDTTNMIIVITVLSIIAVSSIAVLVAHKKRATK